MTIYVIGKAPQGTFITQEDLNAAIAGLQSGVLPGGAGIYIGKEMPSSPTLPSLYIPLDNDFTAKPLLNQDGSSNWQVFSGPVSIVGQPDNVLGSNLVHWWNANIITGLNDNDFISILNDVRATGQMTLLSSSNAQRPKFKNNIQNGKPVVRFDSAGPNRLISGTYPSALPFPLTQPVEIWMSFRLRNAQTSVGILTNGNGQWGVTADSDGRISLSAGNYLSNPTAADTTTFHTWRFVLNGVNSKIFLEGNQVASGNIGNITNSDLLTLGSINGSYNANLDLGELFIVNRLCTNNEATALLSYCQTLWGTS